MTVSTQHESLSRDDLDAKIACAKKLFNEANTSDVRYHEVTNYGDLPALVNYNGTSL